MSGPHVSGGWPSVPQLATRTCEARVLIGLPSIVRKNRRGWNPISRVKPGPEIGDPPESLLGSRFGVADHQGVDPDADLRVEMPIADLHGVDRPCAELAGRGARQASSRSTGTPSSLARTFAVPSGKMPSGVVGPDQAVGDRRDGAVSPGGDDGIDAPADRRAGELGEVSLPVV